MRLFDDRERNDDSVQRADEDTFAFLNRVDDVWFGRVRDLIEVWFAHVPAAEQASLRGRLRSNSEANSAPAFWELYLRELLRRSAFALTHEPKGNHRRRPDFLACGLGTSFYVEAKFVGAHEERQAQQTLLRQITDQLKKIDSPDYMLHFGIRRWGNALPPLSRVRHAVERWLAGLRFGDVAAAALAKEPLPERTFDSGGWVFWFRAMPKGEHARGRNPRAGAIGIGPVTHGGSTSRRLAAVLEQKAGRYGDLGQPFVLALCCGDTFVDWEDIVSALYGEPAFAIGDDGSVTAFREPTGLFSGRGHPRVSAVLTIRTLRVWRAREAVPVLWANPNALFPLMAELPWAAQGRLAFDGEIVIDEAVVEPGTVLGLSEDWPGPERPLRVRASTAGGAPVIAPLSRWFSP